MSKIKNNYGICIQQCEITNSISGECEQLRRGDLLRILEVESSEFTKSGTILIKIYISDKKSFNNNLFECAKRFTAYVAIDLWAYLIGTNENHKRLRIYDERDLILELKCGTEIIIKSYENDSNADIRAEVKLIGTVEEVGIGNFIGLKLQNKPVKPDTLVTIYKKHFNNSTSLLLFRIDQLLDSLHHTAEQKTELKLNVNTKPELASRQSFYPEKIHQKLDANKDSFFTAGDDFYQSNINSSKSNIVSLSNVDLNLAAVDPKDTASAIETNNLPTVFTFRQPPNTSSLFDFLCDSNNPSHSFDCRPLLKPSNVSESKIQITNRSNQHPIYNELEGSLISFPIQQENSSEAQLVDANINEKGAVPKNEAPAATKRNKSRYNQAEKKGRNIPSEIQFTKKPVFRNTNQLERKPLQCNMCSRSFGHDALVFKCKHCICIQCFCIKISNLIGTNRVQCPFTSGKDFTCNYQLQQFELKRLRQKLDEFFLSPKNDDPKPIAKQDDCDNVEELYECKTERCQGKWFLLKSSTVNLYKCPICNINNCVTCKVIHDNMTCTEYQNTLARPNMHLNVNNLVVSKEDTTTESEQIPEVINTPAGNETLMKCKNKNCAGIWFVSNNDKTQFFSCPVCDQYQEIRNRKYSSNFLRSKPTFSRQGNPNQRHNVNTNGGSNNFVNRVPKRNWTCSRCKFINFNSGFTCYKCKYLNTI